MPPTDFAAGAHGVGAIGAGAGAGTGELRALSPEP